LNKLSLEFADDGLFELWYAVDGGVVSETFANSGNGRFLDMGWRLEVRFACAQPDHVFAGLFELAGTLRDGDGGGGLDTLNAVGQVNRGQGRFLHESGWQTTLIYLQSRPNS
jgi:hypothetical protein